MMSWTEVMVAVTVRREWGGEILKDLGPMGLVVICEVRERGRQEDIKDDIPVSALDR